MDTRVPDAAQRIYYQSSLGAGSPVTRLGERVFHITRWA